MQRDSTHQPVSPEAPCEALCLVEEPGDVADAGALLDEEEDAGQAVPHARRHRQPRELPLHDGGAAAAVRPDQRRAGHKLGQIYDCKIGICHTIVRQETTENLVGIVPTLFPWTLYPT